MARAAAAPAGESKRVLVVILVFFILSTIGGGVAAYYGYAEQEKYTAAAKEATRREGIANAERDWYRFQVGIYRAYLGHPAAPDSAVGRDIPDLKAKFDDCAGLVLPQQRLDAAFKAIELVDSMADIRQLVKALV